ncbi:MAG: hypothetical protein ACKO5K_01785, partial [Armatimonadota bacterium]
MKPRRFNRRTVPAFLAATAILSGLYWWGSQGFPMPGGGVPSTKDRIVFVSDRAGADDLYLIEARDGAEPVALTSDEMADREPVFSDDGQLVVFTSNRQKDALGRFAKGVVRQIFVMQAAPGRPVGQLTQTAASSATKQSPRYGAGRKVYFMDGGRVTSIRVDASEAAAVFPHLEQRRSNPLVSELFERGGVVEYDISPDGAWAAVVVQREDDQVLVAYDIENELPAAIGAGRTVHCRFVPDGTLAVAVADGLPFQQPVVIGDEAASQVPSLAAIVPSSAGSAEGRNLFARFRFGNELKADGIVELPAEIDGLAPAPDSSGVAVYGKGSKFQGLVIVRFGAGEAVPLVGDTVESVTFSPDGKRIAYASRGDIHVVGTDGSAPPINLTRGKGRNRQPA